MDRNTIIDHMRALNVNGAEALEEYLDFTIIQHQKTLETVRGEQLIETQGRVAELRALQKILKHLREPREL